MELYQFDDAYFQRLRSGDSATESHFVSYFAKLLRIKLRARYLPPDTVEDLQQETFVRVFRAIRTGPDLRKPDRIGAYVNSVCNNVLQEHYRSSGRQKPLEDDHLEIPDKSLNLEGLLISKETQERVRRVLEEIPERDRLVLRAIFFEERDKDEICQSFHVDRGYLRVLLHRAKEKLRASLEGIQ